ncbi:MAG: ROK family protein [Spartobacteria bacterium]|nr:ROK family protein [Spartobacteria bacterium]
MNNSHYIQNQIPTFVPALDADFRPPILAHRAYRERVAQSAQTCPLVIGLERENGLVSRFETTIVAANGAPDPDTAYYVERIVKFLLWARGGFRLYMGGPAWVGDCIKSVYARSGARAFDVDLMQRVYEAPFEVLTVDASAVPAETESEIAVGGHLDGCRIGFDLGASDYKIAAVKDGMAVYCDEFPWNPKDMEDWTYHYNHIQSGLKRAAMRLPRVDAIGGSSAGVYIDDRPMVASLFRAVPSSDFKQHVQPMFKRIGEEWGVPLRVINDGDVTALAGALSLNKKALLGVAMGSSEAVGYLSRDGRITGWLNELAFAPADYSPRAAADEWSRDIGVGAMYFNQQAVNKLAPAAGQAFPDSMGLPDRLKVVQRRMAVGEEGARAIFESIGVYLGYTIPYYREFYDFDDLLILGRVTSGEGGEIMLEKAREVLKAEFPDVYEGVGLHIPDEKSKRVGQAVAAASLPMIEM